MANPTFRLIIALATAALLVPACGDEASLTSQASGESTTTIAPTSPQSISEQDITTARRVFDANRARWDALEPFAYTMTIGVQTVSELSISFDSEGTVLSEVITRGDPQGGDTDALPRSVDEVFSVVDGMILVFEDGTAPVPDQGECGRHLNARFDDEFGVPLLYDSLGPCDDGVGVVIEIRRD